MASPLSIIFYQKHPILLVHNAFFFVLKNNAGNKQYYCKHGESWFVETANTSLYHKPLPKRSNNPL
jgi:hypothetical protein